MAFVNLSLLLGGLLVAVPIVLHLAMRQQPKHLEFPALRFIRERKEANRRRMSLRHWLLLLMRCAAIALLALTLARPSVASAAMGNWLVIGGLGGLLLLVGLVTAVAWSQSAGRMLVSSLSAVTGLLAVVLVWMVWKTAAQPTNVLLGDQESPVAAVLVIDTSPRMQYRHDNQTRLEQARDTALWLLKQLPDDSEIAVLDSRLAGRSFAVDRGAAQKGIDSLQLTTVPRPLPEVLLDALQLAKESEQARKEIYVLTDLTAAAWTSAAAEQLRQRLAAAADVSLYLIDVGVERPQNFALGEIVLSEQTLPAGGTLRLRTDLARVGPAGTRTAELYLEKFDPLLPILRDGKVELPEAVRRRRETLALAAEGSHILDFQLPGLELGTHHGTLRLVGEDALPIDDVRYFTVEVRPAWPILVAAPPGVMTQFLTEALAPLEFRETGQAQFRCDVVTLDELSGASLDNYAAVMIVDPTPLPEATWQQLAAYAESGHGVGIFLGANARPVDAFQKDAALAVLPGKLSLQFKAGAVQWHLSPRAMEHPLLAPFRDIATTVPWYNFPIYRHWTFNELAPGTTVVLPFSNNRPALLERPLGKGSVMVMTTPISDPANLRGRDPWNLLPTGEEPWPFVMLANEMARYLTGSGRSRFNYQVGQQAVLRDPLGAATNDYLLFTPQGGRPQQITARRGEILVNFTETPGAYRLKSARGDAQRGFSANLPVSASRLDRLPVEQLDQLLGAGRYQLARDREQIDRSVGESRVGREFFPLLLLLVAGILALEQLLANRFYRQTDPGKRKPA